jgi:hypothetical protein
MLYTLKDIENIFSGLVTHYINDGARIAFSENNYSSSLYDCHIDLVAADDSKIVIWKKTGRSESFYHYNSGICRICVSVFQPEKRYGKIWYGRESKESVIRTFYQYEGIFTDDVEEFTRMNDKHSIREVRRNGLFNDTYRAGIPFDMDLVLKIVHNRKG